MTILSAENIRRKFDRAINRACVAKTSTITVIEGDYSVNGWVKRDKKGYFNGDISLSIKGVVRHTSNIRNKSKPDFLECVDLSFAFMEGFIYG